MSLSSDNFREFAHRYCYIYIFASKVKRFRNNYYYWCMMQYVAAMLKKIKETIVVYTFKGPFIHDWICTCIINPQFPTLRSRAYAILVQAIIVTYLIVFYLKFGSYPTLVLSFMFMWLKKIEAIMPASRTVMEMIHCAMSRALF